MTNEDACVEHADTERIGASIQHEGAEEIRVSLWGRTEPGRKEGREVFGGDRQDG
jgi:hypothetical protein